MTAPDVNTKDRIAGHGLAGVSGYIPNELNPSQSSGVAGSDGSVKPHDCGATPRLLDVFCGVGGWTKEFQRLGWECTGVDLVDLGYPGELILCDALTLSDTLLDSFDGVVMSPPCEEYARAWLPWLRMDKTPTPEAVRLLQWAVEKCCRENRLVECSKFAARHVTGAQMFGSYALWGDVPALMPKLPMGKERKSGLRPELRAEIPTELASWIAKYFTRNFREDELTRREIRVSVCGANTKRNGAGI